MVGSPPHGGDYPKSGTHIITVNLPCADCEIHDSTALVSFDGETFERLCYHCYVQR